MLHPFPLSHHFRAQLPTACCEQLCVSYGLAQQDRLSIKKWHFTLVGTPLISDWMKNSFFLWSVLLYWLLGFSWASLVAQRLKRLPAMQETWFDPWVEKIPLEKEMATHASIFAWKIPWMKEPGGLQSMGSWRVRHNWTTSLTMHTFVFLCINVV